MLIAGSLSNWEQALHAFSVWLSGGYHISNYVVYTLCKHYIYYAVSRWLTDWDNMKIVNSNHQENENNISAIFDISQTDKKV